MVNIYEILRRNQDGTSEYVQDFLREHNIEFSMDDYGNIYYLDHENVPLLSAHMDTVRKDADFCIGAFLTENDNDKIFSGGILGGDDKCGVYIILKALEIGKKVNFIFSRDEEIGCLGIKALLKPNWSENKELADKIRNNCLYCLVLDRRSNGDIICFNNNYGTSEFEKALEKKSEEGNFGYKAATGSCSDANTIRDFISTANLSVGYYNPHSQKEYILKADLNKAFDYTVYLIDNLKDKFVAAEYKYSSYGSGNYYSYGNYGSYGYRNYGYGDGKFSKDYKSKRSESNYYSYYDDDFDGFDYSEWSWQNWKDYDTNKGKEKRTCAFCDFDDTTEPIYDITMPDGNEYKICEFCLQDLESEIKKIRLKNPSAV